MAFRVFLHVNVLVDFFDAYREHHDEAKQLMQKIEDEVVAGFVSESVINTTVYIIQKGFTPKDLRKTIDELVAMLVVLPCTNKTIHTAYMLPTNDLEDAVLYQIALENKLDFFITFDKAAYKKLTSVMLPVITAKEFLKMVE